MIKVGLTNAKNLKEANSDAPSGIRYSNIHADAPEACKGFYDFPKKLDIDLIESNIPCVSEQNHIQHLHGVIFNFDVSGKSLDRIEKEELWRKMILRDSCKKVVLKSNAVYEMMTGKNYFGSYYFRIKDKEILAKTEVVFPGFKHIPYMKRKESDTVNILFDGSQFYKDGGEQAVNSFLELQKRFDIKMFLYSKDLFKDKRSYDSLEHKKVIAKINSCKDIVLIDKIDNYLRKADIFLRPTIKDHDGYSSLIMPMNYSLPVITTDFSVLNDIAENNKEGLVIPIRNYNYTVSEKRGSAVLSERLKQYMQKETLIRLKKLIEDKSLRQKLGRNANRKIESRFSLEKHKKIMKKIYIEAAE
jgi:glycosyltransferase involved in cell wall biosynthesis